jgi:hypothetical protein
VLVGFAGTAALALALAIGPGCSNTSTDADGGGAGRSDAGGDASSAGDGSSSGTTVASCTTAIDTVLGESCTRCWPAYRATCASGNVAVIEGLLQCLTSDAHCWDPGDPNTAVACVQQVIGSHAGSGFTPVRARLAALGCISTTSFGYEAAAAALSASDLVALGSCLSAIGGDAGASDGGGACDDTAVSACFERTAFEPSLCNN